MAEEKIKKSFFKEMKKELKKVIWPTKKQTVKNTLAVIFIVLLVSITVIALDEAFIFANNFVVDKVTGGQISETKNLSKQLERLQEIKQQGLIDDETYTNIFLAAYMGGMDSATLQATIDEVLNQQNNQQNNVTENTDTTANQQ